MPRNEYVFDSGPFIYLKNYPEDIFTSLWQNIINYSLDGRIISSIEVKREIERKDDAISKLCKRINSIFYKPTIDEQYIVSDILKKYPKLIKDSSVMNGYPEADPFVIALAKNYNRCLITTEKLKPHALKIPNVCQEFKVETLDLYDFLRREEWKF